MAPGPSRQVYQAEAGPSGYASRGPEFPGPTRGIDTQNQNGGMPAGPSFTTPQNPPAQVYNVSSLPSTIITPGFEHLSSSVPLNAMFPTHGQPPIDNSLGFLPQPPFQMSQPGPSMISTLPLQPRLPNGLPGVMQPQFIPTMPGHAPIPQPGFTFGHPPPLPPGALPPRDLWPNNPDWDDERFAMEYGDGGDMMYGQLEVSLKSAFSSFLSSIDENTSFSGSSASSPTTTLPSPASSTFTLSPQEADHVHPQDAFPSVPPPSAPASPTSPPFISRLPFTDRFPNPPPSHKRRMSQDHYEVYKTSTGADFIPPLKVKHRRRTTPEQLKVLEHWFDVNPKPDNNLREWLAMELGMTKRNVQVWFQNRSV